MIDSDPEGMKNPDVGDPVDAVAARRGVGPYSTGGGGVTFERQVAVQYLAHLLVGDGAIELGDGRSVVEVSFQQAPVHPVDDLVVSAARADELDPSLLLSVGVRRAPKLVPSGKSTPKLIRDFVRAAIDAPQDGPEHRFALVVAGMQDHAKQLAELANIAAGQKAAPAFFDLVGTPKKFHRNVTGRLGQIKELVRLALVKLEISDTGFEAVQSHTWALLSQMTILMPRLETPDETDWMAMTNSLIPVARGNDLDGACRLRDRLVALAADYAPNAATVTLKLLRRDAHDLLDSTLRRHQRGWQLLAHLHKQAVNSVRSEIISLDGTRRTRINRGEAAADLLSAATQAVATVVHGESGVGKSALTLLSMTASAAAAPDSLQVLCINLRHIPPRTVEFEALLGCPLATLLDELSAPQRVLIVDSADTIAEGSVAALRYLV